LYVMPQASLDKHNIEVLHGVRVDGIDRARKTVALSDGRNLSYDKLALTTGGRARPLNLPGASRPNVFLLRSIADVDGIRAQAQAGKCMVVVGGGFIGLETAAVAAKLRLKVTVLEGLPRVLARVTVPEVSEFFERAHREAGVDLRTGVQVTALVVVGIGLIPNTELAQAAGLAVNNGIVVDQFTQTEDPDIVAAGDCTNHPSDFAGRRLRLESVQNAMEQGRAAAHAMLGKAVPYQMVPWFWSDQYDLKLQMVGLSTDFEQMVLRGDPATQRSFATFYLRDGVVIAADAISRPQDFMLAKKMVAARLRVDPAQLADESVALKTLVP
jgi:3-phenylpropionate/trans-cinnamate dioxygenase ferredoxin reductase component